MVTLKVYDVLGNEVATLVNEEKSSGTYEVEFNSQSSHSGEVRNLPSGIYFYKLITGNFVDTKKMILLK
ncbi:MAG: T9SS type A sorting domain-containing protein [Ignavibacteriaceae bacterium]|nr:T9SS type A sorting domain-containing protein [Ignavibacteriaceae bacterium]